ncbi:MAG: putative multidrug export ATP-binding/permease protein [Candidatus Heimdallarchaeota archaeon LC_3]|nr:MAG: putative multidrug export ATP-binding/permease protein [Candidatus Heimdallarchaeota archaeon LC_3]
MREFARFIYPYVVEHKKYFLLINFTVILQAFVQVNIILKINEIIDTGINVQSPVTQIIIDGFIILISLALVEWFLNLTMRFGSVHFSQGAMESIRRDFFKKMQDQELEFYSKETVGQLMERTIDSVFQMQEILTWGWRIILLISWLSIGTFIAMWTKAPVLAFFFLLIFPIIILVLVRSSNRNAKIFYNTRLRYGELNEVLAENLSGIRTVKSFGREPEQIKIFEKKNTNFSIAAFREIRVRAFLRPGMVFLLYLGIIVLLFIGGAFTQLEIITVGNFIAFILLVIQISVPGRFLGDLGIAIQMANAASIRLTEIMNSEISIQDEPGSIELEGIEKEITFENVSFHYPNSETEILHDINLTIQVGEKIALLGATGSGKSTLINLIPRFFDVSKGKIKIDGHDIKNFTKNSLRKHIGIVHQDNFLFTMSIHDNIAFGNPKSKRNDVIKAGQIAQAHEFIVNDLPNSYDSIIGERGVTLSGGQRQRVTIARAIITNPDLLILDDALSAVDPETEAKLQGTLKEVAKTVTMIVISQRPSSLQFVDRIIVIDEGKIVQEGSHQELLSKPGIYQKFVYTVENQVKFIDWERPSEDEVIVPKQSNPSKGGD